MKGHFIVLEGIDGSGKSTQIHHLAQWLPGSGFMPPNTNLHITREPGGTELGVALRKLLLIPPGEQAPEPLTELLLYAADRAQHVCQIIRPTLEKGDWILSDRFCGSTIAYQGYGRKLNLDIIKQLEQIATEGLIPDITIWLDLTVKESLLRRRKQENDRIEAEGQHFLERVALGFQDLAKERSWIRLQANKSPEKISRQIEVIVDSYFQNPMKKS